MGDRPTRAMSVMSDMLKGVGDPAGNESMLLNILAEKEDNTDLRDYKHPHSVSKAEDLVFIKWIGLCACKGVVHLTSKNQRNALVIQHSVYAFCVPASFVCTPMMPKSHMVSSKHVILSIF